MFESIPLGAIIQKFIIGNTNIVLGFSEAADYEIYNSPHFGETIGRVANRVANAQINSLNNQSYALPKNDGNNSIHGGFLGWGKKSWDGPVPMETREIPGLRDLEDSQSIMYTMRSLHGDQGYPGTTDAKVYYTIGTQVEDGRKVRVLGIEYEVELVEDDTNDVEETVVNLTNHSYFNLGENSTIAGTIVNLCTDMYLPVDASGIPTTSSPASYPGMEGNTTLTLGVTSPAIDGCFIVDPSLATEIPLDTRSAPLTRLVTAYHPDTTIHLEVLSTEPAFQFYTGDYIDVPAIGNSPARDPRAGFCVEPSRYVDAINHNEWRGQVVLKKGMKYGSLIVYRGWSDKPQT
ncbi:hypothetical protein K3495_g13918 [Podosphaera aphanis]|nr:hypothetical protein K3495_g13918 [Podosphaera aphanis]